MTDLVCTGFTAAHTVYILQSNILVEGATCERVMCLIFDQIREKLATWSMVDVEFVQGHEMVTWCLPLTQLVHEFHHLTKLQFGVLRFLHLN